MDSTSINGVACVPLHSHVRNSAIQGSINKLFASRFEIIQQTVWFTYSRDTPNHGQVSQSNRDHHGHSPCQLSLSSDLKNARTTVDFIGFKKSKQWLWRGHWSSPTKSSGDPSIIPPPRIHRWRERRLLNYPYKNLSLLIRIYPHLPESIFRLKIYNRWFHQFQKVKTMTTTWSPVEPYQIFGRPIHYFTATYTPVAETAAS